MEDGAGHGRQAEQKWATRALFYSTAGARPFPIAVLEMTSFNNN
jgi:hypothetical protein